MTAIRLGGVDYLNARPLVYGLEMRSDVFSLRFDPPSKCAALLHEGSIDVGMIPTIEYQRGPHPYAIVPHLGIISDGPVASVAVFSRRPVEQLERIAVDTSSRTSVGLLRVLGYELFGIEPELVPRPPAIDQMLQHADAALVIGDAALFLDYESRGLHKTDLGERWTALSGLPFVWAFWAGRPGVLPPRAVQALVEAQRAGVAASDAIADAYCVDARAAAGRAYLRDNIRYTLGERELAGLHRYYALAEKHGVIERQQPLAFYTGAERG